MCSVFLNHVAFSDKATFHLARETGTIVEFGAGTDIGIDIDLGETTSVAPGNQMIAGSVVYL
jgi:hypothetical protein